jgi:hypothetical protein
VPDIFTPLCTMLHAGQYKVANPAFNGAKGLLARRFFAVTLRALEPLLLPGSPLL